MANISIVVDGKPQSLDSEIKPTQIFAEKSIAYNHHSWGVAPNRFLTDRGLASIFTPTVISYDNKGRAFVAAMESTHYPFFGV